MPFAKYFQKAQQANSLFLHATISCKASITFLKVVAVTWFRFKPAAYCIQGRRSDQCDTEADYITIQDTSSQHNKWPTIKLRFYLKQNLIKRFRFTRKWTWVLHTQQRERFRKVVDLNTVFEQDSLCILSEDLSPPPTSRSPISATFSSKFIPLM